MHYKKYVVLALSTIFISGAFAFDFSIYSLNNKAKSFCTNIKNVPIDSIILTSSQMITPLNRCLGDLSFYNNILFFTPNNTVVSFSNYNKDEFLRYQSEIGGSADLFKLKSVDSTEAEEGVLVATSNAYNVLQDLHLSAGQHLIYVPRYEYLDSNPYFLSKGELSIFKDFRFLKFYDPGIYFFEKI